MAYTTNEFRFDQTTKGSVDDSNVRIQNVALIGAH